MLVFRILSNQQQLDFHVSEKLIRITSQIHMKRRYCGHGTHHATLDDAVHRKIVPHRTQSPGLSQYHPICQHIQTQSRGEISQIVLSNEPPSPNQ